MDEIREANVRLVRRLVDAMNGWNFDAMAEMLTEDAVLEVPFLPPGWLTRREGREKVIKVYKDFHSRLVDGSFNLLIQKADTLASDPNEVFITYTSDMKLQSGVNYRNQYLGLYKIRDGKVAWFAEYADAIRATLAFGGKVEMPAAGR